MGTGGGGEVGEAGVTTFVGGYKEGDLRAAETVEEAVELGTGRYGACWWE